MSGNDLGPRPPEYPRQSWPARHQRILVAGAGIVVLAVLAASTWVGGWGAVAHSTCVSGGTVDSTLVWTPVILVNAPYGGYGTGFATISPGVIGNMWIAGEGSGIPNGSYGGVFEWVFANVSENANQSVWGPGANVRCDQKFTVSLVSDYNAYSGMMGNQGNWNDSNEPHTFTYASDNGEPSAYFDNGYSIPNEPNISTCGTGQRSLPVQSAGFTVWLNFTIQGRLTAIPYYLPFPLDYHYTFPAQFGTWQVDSLSAPGGPGGGWAFNFVGPCG